jgi:small subunit ribosomal protein S1
MRQIRRAAASEKTGSLIRELRFGAGANQSRLILGKVIQQGGTLFATIYDDPQLIPFEAAERGIRSPDRQNVESPSGDVILSVRGQAGKTLTASAIEADRIHAWRKIYKAFWSDELIEGVIARVVAGGLLVRFGELEAFLPNSQIDLRPASPEQKAELIGTTQLLAVEHIDGRGDAVVSRRRPLAEEAARKRQSIFETLVEGQIVHGKVKNIVDYGAFVDCGGLDGLLHMTEMSWGRVTSPHDYVKIGDLVDAKIIRINQEKRQVQLSFKALTPDPWESADLKYPMGTRVEGVVSRVVDYGVFVRLEEGVEGLAHKNDGIAPSDLPLSERFIPQAKVTVTVRSVDKSVRRLSLAIS